MDHIATGFTWANPAAANFTGDCNLRSAGPDRRQTLRWVRSDPLVGMVRPATSSHPIVGLDSQDGGPPNAADKRIAPRRAGGTPLAGRAVAVGAVLAGASPSKDRDTAERPSRASGVPPARSRAIPLHQLVRRPGFSRDAWSETIARLCLANLFGSRAPLSIPFWRPGVCRET